MQSRDNERRRVWQLLGLGVLFTFGCSSVLGVEEAQCDPDFDEACAPKRVVKPPTAEDREDACESYCEDVIDACEEFPQFNTESGCMTVCQNMYEFDESEDGLLGNTVQCRAQAARVALDFTDGLDGSCVVAGPMGPGCGGTACENYCAAMERFCEEEFELMEDCDALCRDVPREVPYTDNFEDSNSLECRVYHIQLSVIQSPSRLLHCGHAAGKPGPCEP